MFTIIKQSHLLLIKYLNQHIGQILLEKIEPLYSQAKLKVYFVKNALEIINKEDEWGNYKFNLYK